MDNRTEPADSFGSAVEETQSSAPGGPGDDLLGGGTSLSVNLFFVCDFTKGIFL